MSIIRLRSAPLPGDGDPFTADLAAFGENWAGSFETDTAKYWQASDGTTDRVWLTPSGRWVVTSGLHGDAYVTTEWARTWLTRHGYPEVIGEHIDVEHDGRGRPEIGPEVKFRLPEQYRAALDRLAARNGLSRAQQLRAIVLDTVPLA